MGDYIIVGVLGFLVGIGVFMLGYATGRRAAWRQIARDVIPELNKIHDQAQAAANLLEEAMQKNRGGYEDHP